MSFFPTYTEKVKKVRIQEGGTCFPMRRRENKRRIQGKGKQLTEPSPHRKTTIGAFLLKKDQEDL